MEAGTGLIFLGSKITVDGDCSHEIKRHLLFKRKVMTKLDSVLQKQRHHSASTGLIRHSCHPSTVPCTILTVAS